YDPSDPPYTRKPARDIQKSQPDAEWLYGSSVVAAALSAGARTFYKLHHYAGPGREAASKRRDARLLNVAQKLGVRVVHAQDVGELDAMAGSRPHNGYVLECSPLPQTPVLALTAPTGGALGLQPAQHGGDAAAVPEIPVRGGGGGRHPFVLMLDSILDPGNLGAILRSAYYLGCTAVIVSGKNCAPLTPVALKSSAGASEFLPLLSYANPAKFIEESKAHGWTFYAAVPPLTKNQARRDRYLRAESEGVRTALEKGPTVLVMGGEGEGLRDTVRAVCDYCVSVGQPVEGKGSVVDSLNVSVAAAVLCQAFL
ncbi:Alpha/beta knot methyltransferase, partial [Geopyxis carbonaria]